MHIDSTDAQKTVRDAGANLDSAKLALQKLIGNDQTRPLNKQQAENTLLQDYDNGFNAVANSFLDLPTIMTGIKNILLGTDLNKSSQNIDYYTDYTKIYDDKVYQYRDSAQNSYDTAYTNYNKNFNNYKTISRYSNVANIEDLIGETYSTTKDISDAIKNTNNLIQFYEDKITNQNLKPNPVADTHLTLLNTYTGQINGHLNTLLSIQTAITNDKNAVANASIDVESQQLSLQKSQNALQDAKDNLANYYVYAPFDGVVATMSLVKGQDISSGTTAATMITTQGIAEIPFNEIDISKIKVDQKANLTFDAIDGLNIVGSVAEVDSLGTVSQGVVTYSVKIVFETQNSQVKPGMSTSVSVITNVKQDVIAVSNSAVKTQGNSKYVQVLINGAPKQVTVTTGISSDTDTEITSGLSGGENVITQTVTSSTAKTATTTSANSAVRIPGVNGGGGGFGGGNFRGN